MLIIRLYSTAIILILKQNALIFLNYFVEILDLNQQNLKLRCYIGIIALKLNCSQENTAVYTFSNSVLTI